MSAEVVKKKDAGKSNLFFLCVSFYGYNICLITTEGTNVKLEGQDGETITDIQNYLETFNKEIQGK